MKQVSIKVGSRIVLLLPRATIAGEIVDRKLNPQRAQSADDPIIVGFSRIHQSYVRMCQSNPVRPPRAMSPRKIKKPLASRGTYRTGYQDFLEVARIKQFTPSLLGMHAPALRS